MAETPPAGPSPGTSRASSTDEPSLESQRKKLDMILHGLAVWYTILAIVLFASLTAIAMIFAEMRDIRQVETEREQVKRIVLGQTTASPLFVGTELNQTCIRDLNKLVNDLRESIQEQQKMFEEEYKNDRDQTNKMQLIYQEILQPYDKEAAKKAEEALIAYIQESPGFRTAVYFYSTLDVKSFNYVDIHHTVYAFHPDPANAITFGDVRLNIGSCYNGENGIFTAKYRGIYMFEVHVMTEDCGNPLLFILQKKHNDEYTDVFAVRVQPGFGENSDSNSAVIKLEEGDMVYMRSTKNHYSTVAPSGCPIKGSPGYTTPISTFTGAMLYICEDNAPCDDETDLSSYKRS